MLMNATHITRPTKEALVVLQQEADKKLLELQLALQTSDWDAVEMLLEEHTGVCRQMYKEASSGLVPSATEPTSRPLG